MYYHSLQAVSLTWKKILLIYSTSHFFFSWQLKKCCFYTTISYSGFQHWYLTLGTIFIPAPRLTCACLLYNCIYEQCTPNNNHGSYSWTLVYTLFREGNDTSADCGLNVWQLLSHKIWNCGFISDRNHGHTLSSFCFAITHPLRK